MRPGRFALGVIACGVLVSSACAHTPESSGSSTKAPRIQPPKMLRSDRPNLQTPEEFRAKIQVLVDENGRADIRTLRITGHVSGSTRQALTTWIENARFAPATQAGNPVPGVYSTELRTTVSVRRVR